MKKNDGFTMVEMMIVIGVMAIGIALAVPSFRDMIERKAVGGAAEAAYEQLQRARSQALKRSKPILVDFYAPAGTNWAIGFTDKLTGCVAESALFNQCTIDYDNDSGTANNYLMVIKGANYKNITMSVETAFAFPGTETGGCASAPAGAACFDYVRGLSRTGAYDFDSANYKLRVEVSMLGNVKVCVPSGEKKIPGYNDC